MAASLRVNIVFAADFRSVDQARGTLLVLCRGAFPLQQEAVSDFCMAANEAMNNAVEHSGCSLLEVELHADDQSMTFRMSSDGERFDPTGSAAMPEPDELGELPEGGYGLALIQEFVDGMAYQYRDGKNVVTLVKNINKGV
ncbi:MAG: hypothetical protein A2075_08230 [Geobacteraceae bacterium GWC2_58_44]|nr:MAG: hypothetical protein A2075_08230 [Geobacteraceae bacterium GWC2_58_44]HBG07163.1 hypothetical protein [Geobacter sp.]